MRLYLYLTVLMLFVTGSGQAINSEDAKEAYENGHEVMQKKEWREAIESFEQAAKDRKLKSAANYWQAYAHYQLKQRAQARRLLERLIVNDPESEWVDDAEVLLIEHGDGVQINQHQAELDDDLKLFTLQQIMFNNPDKALPKVYEMLEKSESERVKMNAIQLLGLSDQEEVVDYLFRFIEKEKSKRLQHQAIEMLSLRDGEKIREKLAKLYDKNQDKGLKAAIIQGFIHQDDSKYIIELLNKEKDEELGMRLIQMLGIKGEVAALKEKMKSAKGNQKMAILQSLAMTGDSEYLFDVIENESDQYVRNFAINSLVMVDDDNLGEYLLNLYEKAKDSSEKDVIVSVFMATDMDPKAISKLVKSEDNEERKQSLLVTLMAMGAVDELKSIYSSESNAEIKTSIIQHLGALGAVDELMSLQKLDPSLGENSVFYEAFGMSDDRLNEAFLIDRFKQGNEEVREGILHAFMMQENSGALVKLLKEETDHEVKKQIIQIISITDPDALIEAIED